MAEEFIRDWVPLTYSEKLDYRLFWLFCPLLRIISPAAAAKELNFTGAVFVESFGEINNELELG